MPREHRDVLLSATTPGEVTRGRFPREPPLLNELSEPQRPGTPVSRCTQEPGKGSKESRERSHSLSAEQKQFHWKEVGPFELLCIPFIYELFMHSLCPKIESETHSSAGLMAPPWDSLAMPSLSPKAGCLLD